MFWWFILYTTQQKWQKKDCGSCCFTSISHHIFWYKTTSSPWQNLCGKSSNIMVDVNRILAKCFMTPKPGYFFGVFYYPGQGIVTIPICEPWCMVYLRTWLGDFGQGQMLRNIPAPWSIWDTGQGKSVTWKTSTDHGRQWSWTLLSFVHQSVNTVGKPMS